MDKYPYFINPAIDALPTATGEERMAMIRRIAVCVGDEATLRSIIGIDPEEFSRFYPDMLPPELTTDDTISSFISKFSSEKAAETPQIEEIIAAPAIDYASMLEQEDMTAPLSDRDPTENSDDPTSDIISNFLQAVPPKRPSQKRRIQPKSQPAPQPTPQEDDSGLSEALFKLMVKNRNYTKALEIITELSLNNPKKSIYFAYQMRFLKKLIKNQKNEG